MIGSAPFFVTGLPRSRTAWVANWLTTDWSVCYHDVPYSKSRLQYGRFIGFAGPELAAQFEQIRQEHPESPWVIIRRNTGDALAAFLSLVNRDPRACYKVSPDQVETWWRDRVKLLDHIEKQPRVMSIAWEKLDVTAEAEALYHWLMPQIAFHSDRYELLRGFNVTQKAFP